MLVVGVLARRAERACQDGDFRRALRLLRWFRWAAPAALDFGIELQARRGLGDVEGALAALHRSKSSWLHPDGHANALVDLLISVGRYREALEVEVRSLEPSDLVLGDRGPGLALIEVNRAEAEYALGCWADAEARLLRADVRWDAHPLVRTGHRLQLAWVLAHRGAAAEALARCDEADEAALPPLYRAELHFARASALLAAGRIDEAAEAVERGRALAKRPWSVRNGLFLLARVHAAAGRLVEAESLCRRAAEDPWKLQGGDGLLHWGDVLRDLGRADDARAAWALALERDPESEAADTARARLAAARPGA